MIQPSTYLNPLISKRIRTRPLVLEDSLIWQDFIIDNEVTKYFPFDTGKSTRENAEFWIKKQLTRYQENEFGLHALIEIETGVLIGMCGLLTQEVNTHKELELGYHLLPKYRGLGYATEASMCFIEYAKVNVLNASIISIIDIENSPSIQVALSNGFLKEKELIWSKLDVSIYRMEF
jgi:ribosomal-protein-alanine N-acetyltransferase